VVDVEQRALCPLEEDGGPLVEELAYEPAGVGDVRLDPMAV